MKISKSLLQAIALGVALGTVSTSCTKDTYAVEPEIQGEANPIDLIKRQQTLINTVCPIENSHNCPGCGMG